MTDASRTDAPVMFRVMRADDNGNEVEIARTASREEAEVIARDFEARAHKQIYWVEPA